jgi:hypothetical protein
MPQHIRIPGQGMLNVFSKAELANLSKGRDLPPVEGLGPMQDRETEVRLAQLRLENERLTTEIAEADRRDVDLGTIEALERQNDQLAQEAASRGLDKSMTDMEKLRTLEQISKGVTTNHEAFAKQAEDLIEGRVEAIMAERGVTKSRAYAIASQSDPIAKQAYAMLTRSQDAAAAANRATDALGSHI